LISAEGGVGRGLEPLSTLVNADGKGSAGTDVTSYAPSATFITNKQRAFVFNPNYIGIADFSESEYAQLLYWHASTITGRLIFAPEPIQLAQHVSKTLGTMEALPEWAL
jgi:sulfoquinovosidase